MCRIGITLNTTNGDGTSISSASGKYAVVGTSSWVPFTIDLSNPRTPDITTPGFYKLEITVTNNIGVTSLPSTATFSVTTTCGDTTTTATCSDYIITGLVGLQPADKQVDYVDCGGVSKSMTASTSRAITICARNGSVIPTTNGTYIDIQKGVTPCTNSTTTTTIASSIAWNVYVLIPVDPSEICTTTTETIAYSAPNTTFITGTKLWVDPAMTIPMTMFDRIRLMGSARAYYMSGQTIGSSLTC